MAKIQKHAEFMEKLHGMVTKEATAGTATGKPSADTHYTSVSKETEHVDKNKEGKPETNPQEFKQEKASDPSDPTKTHKAAEDTTKEAAATPPNTSAPAAAKEDASTVVTQGVSKKKLAEEAGNEKLAQLGQQLLDTINEMQKSATAGTATGKPSADTNYQSLGSHLDHVDKNKQGKPENNPQEFKQEKAHDESDPTKTHKAAEATELDKEASFELGRQFARAFLSTKTASVDANIYKEAGRRDFEALIAQASAELDQETPAKRPVVKQAAEVNFQKQAEEEQIKQAEEAGAQAFYTLLKQAQEEEQANQTKLAFEQKLNAILSEKTAAEKKAQELSAKIASYEADMAKQAEEAKLEAKFATWGGRIVDEVITRLKNEPSK